jgi:hypothetical protein
MFKFRHCALALYLASLGCSGCGGGDHAPAPGSGSIEKGAFCKEHNISEAACTKCDPKLIAKYKAAGDYCEEHGFPESECPLCKNQPTGQSEAPKETGPVQAD